MKKSEVTRQALLGAALHEFSEFGIAGARVDRIALRAGVNKMLIYHYFGSKNELFEATFLDLVIPKFSGIPLDDFDLLRFAEAVSDVYEAQPEILRVLNWYRLHSMSSPALDAAMSEATMKVHVAVEQAQKAGKLPNNVPTDQLITMTFANVEAPYTISARVYDLFDGAAESEVRLFVRRGVQILLEGLTAEMEHAHGGATRTGCRQG